MALPRGYRYGSRKFEWPSERILSARWLVSNISQFCLDIQWFLMYLKDPLFFSSEDSKAASFRYRLSQLFDLILFGPVSEASNSFSPPLVQFLQFLLHYLHPLGFPLLSSPAMNIIIFLLITLAAAVPVLEPDFESPEAPSTWRPNTGNPPTTLQDLEGRREQLGLRMYKRWAEPKWIPLRGKGPQ
ncbi:hypothetical protein BDD12DRAFT_801908 [Trichophaea hybrida]|nr:hypothetical protein BDD12DRAFT_801908 [Trichophaea hybrida]